MFDPEVKVIKIGRKAERYFNTENGQFIRPLDHLVNSPESSHTDSFSVTFKSDVTLFEKEDRILFESTPLIENNILRIQPTLTDHGEGYFRAEFDLATGLLSIDLNIERELRLTVTSDSVPIQGIGKINYAVDAASVTSLLNVGLSNERGLDAQIQAELGFTGPRAGANFELDEIKILGFTFRGGFEASAGVGAKGALGAGITSDKTKPQIRAYAKAGLFIGPGAELKPYLQAGVDEKALARAQQASRESFESHQKGVLFGPAFQRLEREKIAAQGNQSKLDKLLAVEAELAADVGNVAMLDMLGQGAKAFFSSPSDDNASMNTNKSQLVPAVAKKERPQSVPSELVVRRNMPTYTLTVSPPSDAVLQIINPSPKPPLLGHGSFYIEKDGTNAPVRWGIMQQVPPEIGVPVIVAYMLKDKVAEQIGYITADHETQAQLDLSHSLMKLKVAVKGEVDIFNVPRLWLGNKKHLKRRMKQVAKDLEHNIAHSRHDPVAEAYLRSVSAALHYYSPGKFFEALERIKYNADGIPHRDYSLLSRAREIHFRELEEKYHQQTTTKGKRTVASEWRRAFSQESAPYVALANTYHDKPEYAERLFQKANKLVHPDHRYVVDEQRMAFCWNQYQAYGKQGEFVKQAKLGEQLEEMAKQYVSHSENGRYAVMLLADLHCRKGNILGFLEWRNILREKYTHDKPDIDTSTTHQEKKSGNKDFSEIIGIAFKTGIGLAVLGVLIYGLYRYSKNREAQFMGNSERVELPIPDILETQMLIEERAGLGVRNIAGFTRFFPRDPAMISVYELRTVNRRGFSK